MNKTRKIAKSQKELGKKTIKSHIAEYVLYIYLHFIKDNDVGIYKRWSAPFFKILWIVRSIFMWIFSVVLFPIFFIGMKIEENVSEKLSKIKKIYNLNI